MDRRRLSSRSSTATHTVVSGGPPSCPPRGQHTGRWQRGGPPADWPVGRASAARGCLARWAGRGAAGRGS
jgi:hypothetical protein